MLHITFTGSGAGILRQALRQSSGESVHGGRVVALPEDLSYGPIDPPDPAIRFDWIVRHLKVDPEEWGLHPESTEMFWAAALSSSNERTVWYSRRSANEYAGFLEWVTRAGDLPYNVIDLSEVEVEAPNGPPYKLVSLGRVAPERLDMRSLFALRRPLDEVERRSCLQEWQVLRDQNASLRVLDNGKLVSAEESHFDNLILSQAQTRWLKTMRVVTCAIVESSDWTIMQTGDLYLCGRVAALVDAGTLEARGNPRDWRYNEVRLPGNRDGLPLPVT